MDYVELVVTVQPLVPARDILISELADAGYDSFTESGNGFSAFIVAENFNEDDAKECFGKYPEWNTAYVFRFIKSENWNKNWESAFQPVSIGNQLLIRAPFHPAQPGFELEIIIHPQMSFGTGHHETTWLMAAQLLQKDVNNCEILDMGTGTGILAILAEKRGAKSITAIDTDDWSCENAAENVKLNNCRNIIVEKRIPGITLKQSFHFILANINLNVLLHDLPLYAESLAKNGHLLVSGFFTTDTGTLREKAESLGLKFAGTKEKNNWAMIEFQKI